VLINDAPRALTILRRLKWLGLKIAMDDFAIVPVRQDQDRPHLRFGRGVQSQSAEIVRAVIGLGKALKIR
jgi:EAL domain-containing protein (putative c-di-GMP-specific phosphodiesterase class I)